MAPLNEKKHSYTCLRILLCFVTGLYWKMVLERGMCMLVTTLSQELWEYLAVIGQICVTLCNKLDKLHTTNLLPVCTRYVNAPLCLPTQLYVCVVDSSSLLCIFSFKVKQWGGLLYKKEPSRCWLLYHHYTTGWKSTVSHLSALQSSRNLS